MNETRFLNKVLNGTDVAWLPLGEIAKIQRGASPRPISKYITDDEDGVPWIKIGDTSSGSKYVQKTAQKITKEGAKKSRLLKKGDFIISNSMSFGRPYILNINGAIHDGWASLSSFEKSLNSDFLYHYLSSNTVHNYWLSKINIGSVSNLNANIIRTLQIPVPSLAEQARLVAILETFDALRNFLKKEIKMKNEQLKFYKNIFFKKKGWEEKPLNQLAEIIKGDQASITSLSDGDEFPVWNGGRHPSKFTNKHNMPANTITIAEGGCSGFINFCKTPLWLGDHCYSFKNINENINKKYLFYYLKNKEKDIMRLAIGSTIQHLNLKDLQKIKINYPKIEQQEHIVYFFDKLEKEINTIENLLKKQKTRKKAVMQLILNFNKNN